MDSVVGEFLHPEELLLGAIVNNAIHEAVNGWMPRSQIKKAVSKETIAIHKARLKRTARAWFTSDNFAWLCSMCGADPRTIARAACEEIDFQVSGETRPPPKRNHNVAGREGTCDGCGRYYASLHSHQQRCNGGL